MTFGHSRPVRVIGRGLICAGSPRPFRSIIQPHCPPNSIRRIVSYQSMNRVMTEFGLWMSVRKGCDRTSSFSTPICFKAYFRSPAVLISLICILMVTGFRIFCPPRLR